MTAIDVLIRRIKEKQNPTAMGLDTRVEHIPPVLMDKLFPEGISTPEQAAEAIFEYNRSLIDVLKDIIPCVKVQVAYYEMYGSAGINAFARTCKYAKETGLSVIADVKRNDIGSTATAYAEAYLGAGNGAFDVDFITVNPYLGVDGIKPFVDMCEKNQKGIFVLVKTSNPSSGQLQDVITDDGRAVYERVADLVAEWGNGLIGGEGYSSVGAVVGATYKAQGAKLRKRNKNTFFLVPGYGAQGASASDIAVCFGDGGVGAIVNASRSLLCAWQKAGIFDYIKAVREEATHMKKSILAAI